MVKKKSELIIEFTIKATNTLRYDEVVLGTYTARFAPSKHKITLEQRIQKEIGLSKDLNRVYLDYIEIRPKMIEIPAIDDSNRGEQYE